MSASFPKRTLVGFLRILSSDATEDYIAMTVADLKLEAQQRVIDAGFVPIGQPTAMVFRGQGVSFEDANTGFMVREAFTPPDAVGVFVEVRVQDRIQTG